MERCRLSGRESLSLTSPHEAAAGLVGHRMVRVEEFFLEGFQVLVVQVKLQLEGAVRDPATMSEQIQNLVEHGIEIHTLPLQQEDGRRYLKWGITFSVSRRMECTTRS